MSGGPGDFLSRWSRRKLEVRRADEVPRADANVDPVADTSADEEEDGLGPEEIEALPKVEEITPDTDMTVFLRKGVPELLRKAALRRLWSVDPAIRDYVGDARDYAYDWNVPGGVPGNGPLLPTDDVEAMLERMFGGRRDAGPDKGSPEQEPALAASHSSEPEYKNEPGATTEGAESDDDAVQQSGDPLLPMASSPPAGLQEDARGLAADANRETDAALPVDAPSDEPRQPRRRRHGGARPV